MEHAIHITNKLAVTGVKKVESYSKTKIVLKLEGKHLVVDGENMELFKIDTVNGVIEANGIIKALRYQNGVLNGSFVKKLLK